MRRTATLRATLRPALACLFALALLAASGRPLAAQGEATSHTVRNASGTFLQAVLEVALPVVIVAAAVYLFMNRRRRR